MFSVTPEPLVSKPAYDPQAKQTRAEQPSSDGFAALVDSNATASSDSRPAPDRPVSPRRDTRDARQADAPPKGKDRPQTDGSTGSANNESSAAQQEADPSASPDAKAASGKTGGKDKTASDATKTDDKSGGDDTAASTAKPIVPAIVTDPVAVVIAAAADPATVTGDNPTAGTTATATVAIAGATTVTPADASAAQTPVIADAKTAVAAVTTHAAAPVETTAPETSAAAVTAAATVIKSDGGKTEIPVKDAETAPAKDSKDGKHAADTSAAKASTDQTVKPETAASNPDDKPAEHDKAASESGKTDAESSKHAAKAAPQAEHRAASAPQPALQTDPGLQVPTGIQPQPVQTHAANLTAVPVPAANTAFTDSAPVPLNGLAADIALRAAGGNSRFEIRLDPAELGRIDVRLDVDKHGNVTSHLTVERPATLDMLRNDAPRLQQALEDAGLKTGDSGLQFSLRDQSSSGRDGDNGSGRNSQRVVITEEDTVPAQVAGRTYGRMLGASSGVDIRI